MEVLGHEENPLNFKCNFCNKAFFTQEILTLHTKSLHDDNEKPKCEFCDQTFTQKTRILKHVREVHSNDPNYFQCNICEKSFSCKYNLTTHKKIHDNEYAKCDLCDKTFSNKSNLMKHMIEVHDGNVANIFQCNFCE